MADTKTGGSSPSAPSTPAGGGKSSGGGSKSSGRSAGRAAGSKTSSKGNSRKGAAQSPQVLPAHMHRDADGVLGIKPKWTVWPGAENGES